MEIRPASYGSSGWLSRKASLGTASPPTPENRREGEDGRIYNLRTKGFRPIGHSRFVEAELSEGDNLSGDRLFLLWPDYYTQIAFTRYQAVAEGRPRRIPHTVDLFV